jgi:hypothetical protein
MNKSHFLDFSIATNISGIFLKVSDRYMYAIALIKVKTCLNVEVKLLIESAISTPGPRVCKCHQNVDTSMYTMVISSNAETVSYLLSISLMPVNNKGINMQTYTHSSKIDLNRRNFVLENSNK